ncbi:DUF4939 domain containing protein [Pyrenophora tritici-repentis]|nr:DUF4939 domain containing protein [Pyrenophora tritici-repentis]
MNRPEPPSFPETPDELTASVAAHPREWLIYLRNTAQYAQKLEESHAASQDQEQSLRIQVKEREAVIQYQKEQLAADQKQITKLEIEKTQLAAAATPAVLTPPAVTMSPLTPAGVAKASADDPAGPPAPATPPSSRTPSLSERIPDPKKFDGTRSDLHRFIQQIYGKMSANADRFPQATGRMLYVAGRLTGKAYALMLPKIQYGIPQFVDYPQMLEYLERAFGDPDRTQNAQNRLFQWKQKNLDFTAYLSEFQRLALEAEMPESALVPLLFQGISRELQDMLLHSPAPSTEYTSYVNHLQTLDNRYRQHQQQVNRSRGAPSTKNPGYTIRETVGRPSLPRSPPSLPPPQRTRWI